MIWGSNISESAQGRNRGVEALESREGGTYRARGLTSALPIDNQPVKAEKCEVWREKGFDKG